MLGDPVSRLRNGTYGASYGFLWGLIGDTKWTPCPLARRTSPRITTKASSAWSTAWPASGSRLLEPKERRDPEGLQSLGSHPLAFWVAVKELKVSYHSSDATLFTLSPYCGNFV